MTLLMMHLHELAIFNNIISITSYWVRRKLPKAHALNFQTQEKAYTDLNGLECGTLRNMCQWASSRSVVFLSWGCMGKCWPEIVSSQLLLWPWFYFFIRFYLQSVKRHGRVWWTDCKILFLRRSCEVVSRFLVFLQVLVWGVFDSACIWKVYILAINISSELSLCLKGKKFQSPMKFCSACLLFICIPKNIYSG